jgi:hypothetical protein
MPDPTQNQPSGPRADPPATAGEGETKVKSETPENREGRINPSAPNDGITRPADSQETTHGKS